MAVNKDYKYSTLLKRIDEALEHSFYLEAAWIAYAVLEDRLVSALRESGSSPPIKMLGPKIVEIKRQMLDTPNLRKAFFGDMIDRLTAWKDLRNDLMHTMAGETKSIAEIDALAKDVAIMGRELARDFCAACRRFKKSNAKQPV